MDLVKECISIQLFNFQRQSPLQETAEKVPKGHDLFSDLPLHNPPSAQEKGISAHESLTTLPSRRKFSKAKSTAG